MVATHPGGLDLYPGLTTRAPERPRAPRYPCSFVKGRLSIVEVLGASRGKSPLIIEDLDVYPQLPRTTGAPTLNSEEPVIEVTTNAAAVARSISRRTSGLTGLKVLVLKLCSCARAVDSPLRSA